jgi:hypothetical protein
MADGGGLTASKLTADLAARAIIAAAASYGDHPVTACLSRVKWQRRCLSAAVGALQLATSRELGEVGAIIGIKASTVSTNRCRPDPRWTLAHDAALAAIGGPAPRATPAAPVKTAVPAAEVAAPAAPRPAPTGPRILSAAAVRREIREALETDNATPPDLIEALKLSEAQVRQGLREMAEAGEVRSDPLTEEGWRAQYWRKVKP